jgi:hypothetical protein
MGHPLGQLSTGKTLLSSIFFLEFFLAAKVFFTGRIRSLHFVRLIRAASCEAIRSVTHQVLARYGQLGLFAFFLNAVFVFSSFLPSRPTRFSESRKHSVPSRVHLVFKIHGSGAAGAGPVQPLLDSRHGRIASKFISTAFSLLERESGRIQSVPRALRQPLSLACARSP